MGAKLSRTPQNASVLITALTMRRRLERHVPWDVASTKHVVSPQWLRACAEQDKLLPFSQFETINASGERRVSLPTPSVSSSNSASFSTYAPAAGPSRSPKAPKVVSKAKPTLEGDHTKPLSTHRRTPLVCPNQALCEELAIIMKARFLEGETIKELSYSRAIATLKAYPKLISNVDEVTELPGIGPKMRTLVQEYIDTGSIAAARKAADTERFRSLSELTQIHGIGPTKAREYYEAGQRSVKDMLELYESKRKGDKVLGILAALRLHDELITKIPRSEVESIAERVYTELDAIQKGCEYTICGGHRRGKPFSNDIDIIFTHREPGLERHLCTRLVKRLQTIGVVKHVLQFSSYTSDREGLHGRQKYSLACMDVLDKALVILKLPDSTHRRVDLIFAPYTTYWTAIVGWTGSKQFERDIRIHAKQKGLKFDSGGITQQRDSKPIIAYSEEAVFEALGLEYIEPEMRNADV
ncbi:Nucleotidyltransferase [Ceratobasidium sp. AG-I]|nr:Nucleotidyltransferase [Ceratobasidium sp. AG-I]